MKKTPEQKREKEIARLTREKNKPKFPGYLIYFVMIITVIYIADEVATQIGTQMQSVIASQIFAPVVGKDVAVARMSAISTVSMLFSVVAFIYKPLSDRYGRRVFLVVNTLGMGVGLTFISLATNIPVYLLGAAFIAFFIPHDMQAVYIQECAPAKHRGKMYFIIKSLSTVGMLLIPLLRKAFIPSTDLSGWRFVYIIPACVAFISAVIALFCIRESDVFIDNRLNYLTGEHTADKNKDAQIQGSLLNGIKFVFRHRQLRVLYIAGGFLMFGMLITSYYESIMTYGFAQQFVAAGLDIESAKLEANAYVTQALMLFSIGSAIFQMLPSLTIDRLGRKPTAIFTCCTMLVAYLAFYFGSGNGIAPSIVGFCCGAAVGSYWANGDIIGLMAAESAPTNLRVSVTTSYSIISGVIYAVAMLTVMILANILGDAKIGLVCLVTIVPGMTLGLVLLCLKVKETKGMDLTNVDTQALDAPQEQTVNS
ncbi:MAG: MFS transporter [Clostridiales bacterium]|nr:MFS transporter [Clostridiales bacterium]